MKLTLSQKQFMLMCYLSSLLAYGNTYAGTPLVEFISTPASQQSVMPGKNIIVFYTLRNNTPVNFPLNVTTSTPSLTIATVGNTCGSQINANSTCVLPFQFLAPTSGQSVSGTVSVGYHGRAPITNTVNYNVNETIQCSILPAGNYQTAFCQRQYQNLIPLITNIINITNQNVQQGQTLGGVIGIYQHGISDSTCYISCGQRKLNGTPPDQQTMFELASVSKTFTASIFGEKVFENSVNPTDSINGHLPTRSWLGQSYNLNTNMQPVTFQELATFSGGVCFSDAPDVNIDNNVTLKQSDFVKDINLLDRTSATCLGSGNNVRAEYGNPNYLPSHNFYSNSSFGLLAQALMNIDGYSNMDEADFNGWLCEHVTVALGMTMTNACLPDEANSNTCPQTFSYCNTSQWANAQYASGYHLSGTNYQLGDPFPFVPWAGAGNIRSNAQDMIAYIKANLGVTSSTDPSVVDLINGMAIAHQPNNYLPVPNGGTVKPNIGSQSPLSGGQGYAWVCDPSFGNPNAVCGKIGGHANFRSFVGFSPGKQYGIVILFNTGDLSTDGSFSPMTSIPSISDVGVGMINAD